MGNFKLTMCNNSNCDFWQNENCLYGGTAEIKPNANQEGQCKAYEPYYEEDDYKRRII